MDRKGRVMAISLQEKIPIEMAVSISAKERQNERISVKRAYPLGEIGGSVLGYVGKDGYGLSGIEFTFDHYLRGEDGWTILQKDGRNNTYRKIGLPSKKPRTGHDLYLTIDIDAQKIVQTVLHQAVARLQAKGGMCILMEVRTGKILAMADEPSFNPNFAFRYPLAERRNKCISSTYEPGSTFKVVTAAAALQERIMKETDTIDGNKGVYNIYNQAIRDYKAFGKLTFQDALSYSSNVCFAKISNKIGNERLYQYTRDFGFGDQTGIDLPGEETGIVHPIRSWSGRTRVTMAMGHELSVTVLQMMLPFATIANDGVLMKPRIYKKVVDSEENVFEKTDDVAMRRVISVATAKRLRRMMQHVVTEGTGKRAAIEGITVAGKTGTSQKADSSGYSHSRYWSSFIGFAPRENPEIVCGIVIDEPAGGEEGGLAAAPVFRQIITQLISHPDLEFAEKLLKNYTPKPRADSTGEITIPQVCGVHKDKVQNMLKEKGIRFSFVGEGDTVRYQTPLDGVTVSRTTELHLFLDARMADAKMDIVVPNCLGKDLRDAINVLCLQGLTPYVIGAGIVKDQAPQAGSIRKNAEVCTLKCAFGG